MKFQIIVVMVWLAAAGGCYTTQPMRTKAQDLAATVSAYHDQQQARIDRLNQDYRTTFAQLMDDLTELVNRELQDGRNLDAQRLADQIIASDDVTLPSHFRDAFAALVDAQRAKISAADDAIDAARVTYLQAYREATLDLGKLDKARQDLHELSTPEDQRQAFQRFITEVAKAYQDARAAADKQKKGGDSGGSGGESGM